MTMEMEMVMVRITVALTYKIETRDTRAATTDPNYYWNPNTPIYYTIDRSIREFKELFNLLGSTR